MEKILILDDDRMIGQSLKLLFTKQGFEAVSIFNPMNALEFVDSFQPDLMILDMNFTVDTSGDQGLKLLREIKTHHVDLPVILITGWGSLELAVQGMKLGANDFITKPWDNDRISESVKTILSLRANKELAKSNISSLDAIIGESDNIKKIKETIIKIAPTNATVLITGASGTGKELVAEAIHDNSPRKDAEFVKVNLGAIPNELFESELFGHKKGAFTSAIADREGRFSRANKGSIFLDEIGDLAKPSQVKLLRVLQENTFEPLGSNKAIKTDVRVISATHRNLQDAVAQDHFREDLFYRLNLLHIHIPTLNERSEDIPLLIEAFSQQLKSSYDGFSKTYIDHEAIDWLSEQEYSGNIRQLKNIVERAWLLSGNKKLTRKDFAAHFSSSRAQVRDLPTVGAMTLEELEKGMITKTMTFHSGNISQVAKALGITRSALYRRLEKYGLNS